MIVSHFDDQYDEFISFLDAVVIELGLRTKNDPTYFFQRSGTLLESDIYDVMQSIPEGKEFECEHITGQRFPDIIAYIERNNAFGVEVKTTKSNSWRSVGSSIMEGTRVNDVSRIHLLFAKLSGTVEYRHRLYEACLYNVAITHSPRYLIDMDTNDGDSIFDKIGVEYDTLRLTKNPFTPIKHYIRETQLEKGEDVWWTGEDINRTASIRIWGNLSKEEKAKYRAYAFALFPEVMAGKYSKFATYLVSRFGVLDHKVRDTFSAGGQKEVFGKKIPARYSYLKDSMATIAEVLSEVDSDDLAFYWNLDEAPINPVKRMSKWQELILENDQKRKGAGKHYTTLKEIIARS